MIEVGWRAFQQTNRDWAFKLYDDTDVCTYLEQHLSHEDYARLTHVHPIERADLWRLLIMYYEGGLYMDIDREVNMNMDTILQNGTKMLLPSYYGHDQPHFGDFSQDLMCSAPGNPMFEHIIHLNLKRRAECQDHGHSAGIKCKNVGELGPTTFMHGVTQYIFGEMINPHPPNGNQRIMQPLKHLSPTVVTYEEVHPCNTLIYRNHDMKACHSLHNEVMKAKNDFYERWEATTWTAPAPAMHCGMRKTDMSQIRPLPLHSICPWPCRS
eukprot:gnl/TRDRNA2_/TRDRNA2_202898_c0_seq1.p1 gnl/TRDRNA2_/TRDRNA2_202898_c0~~gnl/TRDRNA2_/TRDRNA2_202898_c0_seq1.p1  ORF type:complete len:293 (-),score=15.86 gnl/TRDRNA2_/TRDRNA2_202898_c0_seq1:13-816(-)